MRGSTGGSMGSGERSNARRRRDARRRRSEEAAWAGLAGPVTVRSFRRTCGECSSERLTWGTVGDLVAGWEPEGWDVINERLEGIAASVGVELGPELLVLEAWRCQDCDNSGVFGPWEAGA